MFPRSTLLRTAALAVVPLLSLSACGSGGGTSADGAQCNGLPETPVLSLVGYSTPREAYGKIIPAFQSMWKEEHNDQNVIFQESYGGSTTQAGNVVAGYEADVVALSLAPDIDIITDAGLITHDWTDAPDGGMISTSVVVLDVRPGDPQGIEDFDDLAKPGVEVITPDPAASGGAKWNVVAAWGAALRGSAGVAKGDEAGATSLMQGLLGNVVAFDRSARDSIKNFETGNGDVAVTYENEVLTAQDAGLEDEAVYPPSTVLIENPVAVVDTNVDKHCVREVAEAFVDFLHTDEVKQIFADAGYRSTDITVAKKGGGVFPAIEDLWDVDQVGGWDGLYEKLFSDDGVVTQAMIAG